MVKYMFRIGFVSLIALQLSGCIGQYAGDEPESVTFGTGAQIGSGVDSGFIRSQLIGSWKNNQTDGSYLIVEFTAFGKVTFSAFDPDATLRYSRSGNFMLDEQILTIVYHSDERETIPFAVENNLLILAEAVYYRM